MSRFLIMRPAASLSNVEGTVQGTLDVPLAPLGKMQAKVAGEALRGETITRIVASPLSRTKETAQIVAETIGFGKSVEFHAGLCARDLGEWAGKSRESIKEMWNDLQHPFRNDPHFAPPDGESLHVVEQRTFDAIDEINATSEGLVLFVMHLIGTGAVIDRYTGQRPPFNNTEVWEIFPEEKQANLLYTPSDAFLPGHE